MQTLPLELLDKPIVSMTGKELMELVSVIRDKVTEPIVKKSDYRDENIGCGIEGIAEVLKCGISKAQKLKNKGVFDKALISGPGERIRFYKDKIIEEYHRDSQGIY